MRITLFGWTLSLTRKSMKIKTIRFEIEHETSNGLASVEINGCTDPDDALNFLKRACEIRGFDLSDYRVRMVQEES